MSFLITHTGGGSQNYKTVVRTASTANVALSGTHPSAPVGGVTLANKDRVLLKNQGTASQNGIYVYNVSGNNYTLTRALDANTDKEIVPNMLVPVSEGTYAEVLFQLITDAPIVLDTTPLTFDFAVIYDHGLLVGLGDDDHTQYLNTTRAKTWFDTDYLRQTVNNGNTATVPSEDAVYDHVDTAVSSLANKTLSNLTSPTAINQNLGFNKASAAVLSGSDAKATQANHDVTLRAGNTGSAVDGGHLYLESGTSSTGNGGNIYIRNTGSTIAGRGIYLRGFGAADQFVVDNNYWGLVQFKAGVGFVPDNTFDIGNGGESGRNVRPSNIWFGSAIYGPAGTSGVISGYQAIYDLATASGSLTVKGGDSTGAGTTTGDNPAGSLTLRGGDQSANNAQLPGNITIRAGNKTSGTANGGNVVISGGTSVGGVAGDITINTAATERLKVTNDGNFKLSSGLSLTSRHNQTGTVTVLVTDIYIGCNSNSGSVTVTLPLASTVSAGKIYIIKDEGGFATTNSISIVKSVGSSDTIDGNASEALIVNYESMTLVCDGVSKWFIV